MKYSNVLPPNVVAPVVHVSVVSTLHNIKIIGKLVLLGAPVVYVSVVSTLHNIKSLANSSDWATRYATLWVGGSCL